MLLGLGLVRSVCAVMFLDVVMLRDSVMFLDLVFLGLSVPCGHASLFGLVA